MTQQTADNATPIDLAARTAACKSAADFAGLAHTIVATDPEQAQALLKKAELQCQFPVDYVQVAEVYARDLDNKAYAKDLYEQAEEACFEGHEFAAVGYSVGKYLGDLAKGKELLEKAAAEAKDMGTFLKLAEYAEQGLGDAELAKRFFAKVEEKCKTLADFQGLAKGMIDDNPEAAKALYKKAARYCGDIPSTVSYAQGAVSLFNDSAWAKQILNGAETDCQFPKDFVQLAAGFKEVLDDRAKISELLEQGAEFAMAGDEHLELAKGYWTLLQNKEQACASYKKVVAELNDREQLLSLAKTIATELGDKDLAKTAYAKVETKTGSALDLGKLAQAVCDDLGDKAYASEIYQRAAEKLTGANDLATLAGEVLKNLGDQARAADLFRKALSATKEFNGFMKLLGQAQEKLPADKALAQDALTQAEAIAESTPEFLEAGQAALQALGDQEAGRRLLSAAEERITNLDDMRKVMAAVKTHFSSDAAWTAQLAEKLEKREANQEKYAEFQKREERCANNRQFLSLVDQVMSELQDKFYARKLLTAAEKTLEAQAFNLNYYRDLALAVDRHLGDNAWVERLFNYSASQCQNFASLRQVGQAVAGLQEVALAKQLASNYYRQQETQLDQAASKSVYDYAKLADAVALDLGDHAWANGLLDKASALAGDHLGYAHLGQLATQLGESSKAEALFTKSANACANATQFTQLGGRLHAYRLDRQQLRGLYESGLQRLTAPQEQLHLAEGIINVFNDSAWATQVYDQIAPRFSQANDKALYQASRRHHLARLFY